MGWICKRGNIYVSAVCHLYIMYLAKAYLNQEKFTSHALAVLNAPYTLYNFGLSKIKDDQSWPFLWSWLLNCATMLL